PLVAPLTLAEINEAVMESPLTLTPPTPTITPEIVPPEELTLTFPTPSAVTSTFCCALMLMLLRAKMRPLTSPVASNFTLLAIRPEPLTSIFLPKTTIGLPWESLVPLRIATLTGSPSGSRYGLIDGLAPPRL